MVQDGPARGALRVRAVAAAVMAVVALPALAQSNPADGAPSEAARRQALGPFRMILQNAEAAHKAPKKAPAPVAATPAPAPARSAAAPAPAPTRSAPAPTPATARATEEPAKPEIVAAPVPAAPPPAASAVARAPAPPVPVAPPPVALVPVKQDAPVLPAALRREQPEGIVKVGFAVKPDGSTTDVQVLSSTNRKLNSASVAAVAGWRFQPIGETRPTEVELVFDLDGN